MFYFSHSLLIHSPFFPFMLLVDELNGLTAIARRKWVPWYLHGYTSVGTVINHQQCLQSQPRYLSVYPSRRDSMTYWPARSDVILTRNMDNPRSGTRPRTFDEPPAKQFHTERRPPLLSHLSEEQMFLPFIHYGRLEHEQIPQQEPYLPYCPPPRPQADSTVRPLTAGLRTPIAQPTRPMLSAASSQIWFQPPLTDPVSCHNVVRPQVTGLYRQPVRFHPPPSPPVTLAPATTRSMITGEPVVVDRQSSLEVTEDPYLDNTWILPKDSSDAPHRLEMKSHGKNRKFPSLSSMRKHYLSSLDGTDVPKDPPSPEFPAPLSSPPTAFGFVLPLNVMNMVCWMPYLVA